MEREELKSIVENVLLAADQPINATELSKIFLDGTDKDQLQPILDELREEYNSRNLQIMEVADGYQLCTRHEYNDWIRKYLKLDRSSRLSQPSLDTLSIIAYKQPLTRQEVDDIRGVDSSGVLKTLLEKKVIGPAGRKKVPGRPIMYRTTQKFLEYFGLKDLSDLPTLEDLREEMEGEDPPLQTQIEFSNSEAASSSTSEDEPLTESGEDSADD
ncbi:MAG TPA: SMC-Scp complex subunit ScpB [Nitrospina sp.]|jgi:segregation and condensation protein B|nr:SMC-Scp complex subunit ScpB [Nitrospinota bacterium]HBP11595.1 SMC-Scp complex subunit ScpB [Nitrospina sp.]HCK69509.1 SMC-Scp complex subunit ScpB [Nitrospina sp.]|tara:strand:- start:19 stop:660 length:642 start_codon:yes stop_codon:yes gene_type:complete